MKPGEPAPLKLLIRGSGFEPLAAHTVLTWGFSPGVPDS